MNRNTVSDQYNFSPGSGHAYGQKEQSWIGREHCFYPPVSYYASVLSHLLSQPEMDCELLPSAQKTELLFQNGGSNTSSREVSFMGQLPVSGLRKSRQFYNEHLQAKRARVENIIQGMSIMPEAGAVEASGVGAVEDGDQHQAEKEKKSYRKNRRKQKLPQQQSPQETSLPRSGSIQAEECLQLKKQLHLLQGQLEQLQERFLKPVVLSDSSQSQEKTMHFLKEKLGQSMDDSNRCAVNDHHKYFLWGCSPRMWRPKLSEEEAGAMDSHVLTPEKGTLSELLKQELIQVVTQAVDSVLKKVLSKSPGSQSQSCNSPLATMSSMGREYTSAGEGTTQKWLPRVSSHKGSVSLITEKAPGFSTCSIHSKLERKPCQASHVNYPLIMSSEGQGNGILSQMLLCDQSGHWGSLPPRMVSSPESLDMPWQPIKPKSSVMRYQRYPGPYKSADVESSDTEFAEMDAMMDGMPFPTTHISFSVLMSSSPPGVSTMVPVQCCFLILSGKKARHKNLTKGIPQHRSQTQQATNLQRLLCLQKTL